MRLTVLGLCAALADAQIMFDADKVRIDLPESGACIATGTASDDGPAVVCHAGAGALSGPREVIMGPPGSPSIASDGTSITLNGRNFGREGIAPPPPWSPSDAGSEGRTYLLGQVSVPDGMEASGGLALPATSPQACTEETFGQVAVFEAGPGAEDAVLACALVECPDSALRSSSPARARLPMFAWTHVGGSQGQDSMGAFHRKHHHRHHKHHRKHAYHHHKRARHHRRQLEETGDLDGDGLSDDGQSGVVGMCGATPPLASYRVRHNATCRTGLLLPAVQKVRILDEDDCAAACAGGVRTPELDLERCVDWAWDREAGTCTLVPEASCASSCPKGFVVPALPTVRASSGQGDLAMRSSTDFRGKIKRIRLRERVGRRLAEEGGEPCLGTPEECEKLAQLAADLGDAAVLAPGQAAREAACEDLCFQLPECGRAVWDEGARECVIFPRHGCQGMCDSGIDLRTISEPLFPDEDACVDACKKGFRGADGHGNLVDVPEEWCEAVEYDPVARTCRLFPAKGKCDSTCPRGAQLPGESAAGPDGNQAAFGSPGTQALYEDVLLHHNWLGQASRATDSPARRRALAGDADPAPAPSPPPPAPGKMQPINNLRQLGIAVATFGDYPDSRLDPDDDNDGVCAQAARGANCTGRGVAQFGKCFCMPRAGQGCPATCSAGILLPATQRRPLRQQECQSLKGDAPPALPGARALFGELWNCSIVRGVRVPSFSLSGGVKEAVWEGDCQDETCTKRSTDHGKCTVVPQASCGSDEEESGECPVGLLLPAVQKVASAAECSAACLEGVDSGALTIAQCRTSTFDEATSTCRLFPAGGCPDGSCCPACRPVRGGGDCDDGKSNACPASAPYRGGGGGGGAIVVTSVHVPRAKDQESCAQACAEGVDEEGVRVDGCREYSYDETTGACVLIPATPSPAPEPAEPADDADGGRRARRRLGVEPTPFKAGVEDYGSCAHDLSYAAAGPPFNVSVYRPVPHGFVELALPPGRYGLAQTDNAPPEVMCVGGSAEEEAEEGGASGLSWAVLPGLTLQACAAACAEAHRRARASGRVGRRCDAFSLLHGEEGVRVCALRQRRLSQVQQDSAEQDSSSASLSQSSAATLQQAAPASRDTRTRRDSRCQLVRSASNQAMPALTYTRADGSCALPPDLDRDGTCTTGATLFTQEAVYLSVDNPLFKETASKAENPLYDEGDRRLTEKSTTRKPKEILVVGSKAKIGPVAALARQADGGGGGAWTRNWQWGALRGPGEGAWYSPWAYWGDERGTSEAYAPEPCSEETVGKLSPEAPGQVCARVEGADGAARFEYLHIQFHGSDFNSAKESVELEPHMPTYKGGTYNFYGEGEFLLY